VVPNVDRKRIRGAAPLIGLALVTLVASPLGNACSRAQNLVDEPDGGSLISGLPTCDAGIPEVEDSGITGPELAPCTDRPLGDCQGSNDFPCDFEGLFREVVATCQAQAECTASGCVEAQMGADGCVSSIHMTEPDPAFVACLVESFGAYRCPCGETFARRYLGPSQGCHRPCGTGEHICPSGETCVDGFCEPIGAGGSG
jgi:hypothetical protein